ncbi:hypothetical protein C8R45DRAFT_1076697 [Mycena sanguinolenta]|nr:hypothetical protein C8R45DRAFT_1076697 [Mycena sanguinolenta]
MVQRVQAPNRSKREVFAVVNTAAGTFSDPSLSASKFEGQMNNSLCNKLNERFASSHFDLTTHCIVGKACCGINRKAKGLLIGGAVLDIEAQLCAEIVRSDFLRPQIRNRVVGNADVAVDSSTTLVLEEITVSIRNEGGELGVNTINAYMYARVTRPQYDKQVSGITLTAKERKTAQTQAQSAGLGNIRCRRFAHAFTGEYEAQAQYSAAQCGEWMDGWQGERWRRAFGFGVAEFVSLLMHLEHIALVSSGKTKPTRQLILCPSEQLRVLFGQRLLYCTLQLIKCAPQQLCLVFNGLCQLVARALQQQGLVLGPHPSSSASSPSSLYPRRGALHRPPRHTPRHTRAPPLRREHTPVVPVTPYAQADKNDRLVTCLVVSTTLTAAHGARTPSSRCTQSGGVRVLSTKQSADENSGRGKLFTLSSRTKSQVFSSCETAACTALQPPATRARHPPSRAHDRLCVSAVPPLRVPGPDAPERRHHVRRGRLALGQARVEPTRQRVAEAQIVGAVYWCYEQGFVHRDINPHATSSDAEHALRPLVALSSVKGPGQGPVSTGAQAQAPVSVPNFESLQGQLRPAARVWRVVLGARCIAL